MEVTVKDGQSLPDIAMQCLGGFEGVFALAERNGISITGRLTDGTVLQWEHADTVDVNVQNVYALRGLSPATDINSKEMRALLNATADYTQIILSSQDLTVGVAIDKTQQILAALQSGEGYEPTSDLSLTRIFDNPFDIVFA